MKICLDCRFHAIGPARNVLCVHQKVGPVGHAALMMRARFDSPHQEIVTRRSFPEICEHEANWFEPQEGTKS